MLNKEGTGSDLRIVFMGTPEFAVPSLVALSQSGLKPVLCISQPDKPQGRKKQIVPTPVHQKADELGIPWYGPEKVRNQAFYETIRKCEPDFLVTCAYGRIITAEVLALAKIAAVNVHGSLLPKYRGASPVQAALLNGDKVTGVSIPKMTTELDAGPVYRRAEYQIPDGMRADELMMALANLGADLLPQTLLEIAYGQLQPMPQDESLASHVSMLTKETGFIDWSGPAGKISNQIRGCYPWPGTSAGFAGKKVKILQAEIGNLADLTNLDQKLQCAQPGTIISTENKKIWVLCGQGVLAITELQIEGGKPLSSKECAHNYQVGSLFTSWPPRMGNYGQS